MVHGVYRRASKTALWYLVSASASAETALKDKRLCIEEAQKEGKTNVEAGIRTYETSWFMPESLTELEENDKLLYN